MKNLILKLSFVLILTIGATMMRAQSYRSYTANGAESWSGKGTEESPYIITSGKQFFQLADSVNADNMAVASAYFKLGADITIGEPQNPTSTLVGNSKNHRFYGHFDGDGHTLTVYMNRTEDFAAPFGIADGATFTNLNVEGTITTDHKFAGGIASYVYGKTNGPVNVTNCNSNIHIISNVTVPSNHDGTHAGFVGQCEEGTINFENCVFTGSIVDPVVPHQTIKCAGFLGWVNEEVTYTNCLQAGTVDVSSNMATFQRNKKGAVTTYTNAYYFHGFGDGQGQQVYDAVPENSIAKIFYVNATPYYTNFAVISGISTYYNYADGAPVIVAPVVKYEDYILVENTDYTISFQKKEGNVYTNVNEVTEIGEYKIIIRGAGDYKGTYIDTFKVIDASDSWAELQTMLDSGNEIVLSKDCIAKSSNGALIVDGDVTIDMNGHFIDRNLTEGTDQGYVIKVNAGASLTIVDNSKDKTNFISGGNNIGNGGCIYNEGKLTLENININGNKCIRDSKVYGTGAGIYSTGILTLTNCHIDGNEGDGGGGGIHSVGELTISGGSVSNNITLSKGAGIRVTGKNITITDCTISNNSMIAGANAKHGGGIYVEHTNNTTNLVLTGCTITGNTASDNGGGIYITNGNVTAKDCTISGNSARLGNDIFFYQNAIMTIDDGTTTTNTSVNDIVLSPTNTQLIVPTNSTFLATVQKNMLKWEEAQETGWSAISSPIAGQLFNAVTNLQNAIHNIYRYDTETTVWQEYRAASNLFDSFEVGRGYLYRRAAATTISYVGTLNSSNVSYDLTYTEGNESKSYNLIGNPYSHNITKGANISNECVEEKYCILNANGTWKLQDDDTPIPAGTAILVQAKEAKTLEITNEASFSKTRSNNDNIWFTVANDNFEDVACVEFKNGHGFNKVAHRNADAPMLYISHKGENFASVDMSDDTKTINLNFKAKKTGRYTLSYKAKGMFSYLHLIDRFTGEDVDLLLDDEYSFVASANESESRFIVKLDYIPGNNAENNIFAYQNGNDVIVNGEGTLQVFDAMGRLISTQHIDGVGTWHAESAQTGVYIFKLEGNTQKIVVR